MSAARTPLRPSAFVAAALASSLAACSSANYNPPVSAMPSNGPSPVPAPTATATNAPATACGAPVAGAIFIAIGSYIEPSVSPDATIGTTYGYALVDTSGNYPIQSTPIVVKPNDLVQFVNVDPPSAAGGAGNLHTATGLQSASFPPTHVFPASAFAPLGTTFSNVALWSTGTIPAIADALCYSQPLAVPSSGTFYFGDASFYNTTNLRGALVVSASASR